MCRCVVDEIQPLHRVTGHDDALTVQRSSTPELSSETSLQLKPNRREPLPLPETPSQKDGGGQTLPGCMPHDHGSTKGFPMSRGSVAPHRCAQNDLEKAIEEARAMKDLVSIGKYDGADHELIVS